MSLTILRNAAALVAVRNVSAADANATSSLSKLSAGSRIVSAMDDAASLAISSGLRKQVAGLRQAMVNVGQAASMLQVADGAAGRIQDILIRMKSLSVQAGSGQLGTVERAMLNVEYQALKSEVDRTANNTEFNGIRLINNGGFTYTVRSLPSHGTLKLSGVDLGLGDRFTQSDLDAGRVVYTNDGSAIASDRLILSIAAEDGTALGTIAGAVSTDSIEDAEYFASTGLAQIHASSLNARGGTGAGIKIAIIDTGVLLTHPDLSANIATGGVDILDGNIDGGTVTAPDGNDDADPNSSAGHGTHVAGIAAAENNGSGTQGVAYDAKILPIKVDDPATGLIDANDLADAIDYARLQGTNVINLSLGFSGAVPIPNQVTAAIARAVNAGMVVVAATGNSALTDPTFPASFAVDPTANGQLIAVGAVDGTNALASFSNKAGSSGEQAFTMVAPGVSILSTTFDGATGIKSGTSMAAPYVSGSVAGLMDLFPGLSGKEIANLLLTTTTDLGATGADPVFGRGLLNLDKASVPELTVNIAVQPNSLVTTSGDLNVVQGRQASLQSDLLDPTTVYSAFTGPIVQDTTFKVGPGTQSWDSLLVQTSALTTIALNIATTDIASPADADIASDATSAALDRLLTARAEIGASLNRLDFASGNLATAVENNEVARSALTDLDVASEMTSFTSSQVLLEAGISILAQAENQGRMLLRLLA